MTRSETLFDTDGDLIIVETFVTGPRGRRPGRFVLDTGAAITLMIPELADSIGYSARDAIRRARVRSAIGHEDGFLLRVAEFTALGFAMPNFQVNVFDLDHDDIAGLLGMNFLRAFNCDIRPAEHRLLVEPIAP